MVLDTSLLRGWEWFCRPLGDIPQGALQALSLSNADDDLLSPYTSIMIMEG